MEAAETNVQRFSGSDADGGDQEGARESDSVCRSTEGEMVSTEGC